MKFNRTHTPLQFSAWDVRLIGCVKRQTNRNGISLWTGNNEDDNLKCSMTTRHNDSEIKHADNRLCPLLTLKYSEIRFPPAIPAHKIECVVSKKLRYQRHSRHTKHNSIILQWCYMISKFKVITHTQCYVYIFISVTNIVTNYLALITINDIVHWANIDEHAASSADTYHCRHRQHPTASVSSHCLTVFDTISHDPDTQHTHTHTPVN